MEAMRTNSRSADVWIEESSRPYSLSVQELVETGGLRRFNINVDKVETCIARIMMAVECDEPDTLLAALSIAFVLMVRRFKLKLGSVIQFAENFLVGGDRKPNCAAMQLMFNTDYENTVTRYETVKLSRAVNVSAEMRSK